MSTITLSIYVDESKNKRDESDNLWDYYCLLIIPDEEKSGFIAQLKNSRCVINDLWCENCSTPCGFHSKNNTEIHYTKVKANHEIKISERWIDILLEHNIKNKKYIYFNILAINKSYLNTSMWKSCLDRENAVYTKFFSTAIKSIKYFFSEYDEVLIKEIIHDKSQMEEDEQFYFGLIANLEADNIFKFDNKRIEFLDSDHRTSKKDESHILQFADLLLGLTTNYVHFSSKSEAKKQLTERIAPLIDRIITKPLNKNSRYHYYKRQSISFFPKRKVFYYYVKDLTGTLQSIHFHDLFFTNVTCAFKKSNVKKTQATLFEYL